jgi:hypothetical protein
LSNQLLSLPPVTVLVGWLFDHLASRASFLAMDRRADLMTDDFYLDNNIAGLQTPLLVESIPDLLHPLTPAFQFIQNIYIAIHLRQFSLTWSF